jgi:transcriptional regulator with XRE-family HTH domain
MAFKDNFKRLRQEKNVAQKDLASFFSVAQTTISKWETGERTPSYEMLSKIADYFQVSTDYLLADTPTDAKFDLQMFSNNKASEVYIANAFGKLLTLKNEESKKLTIEIMSDIVQLTIPQLEAIKFLIKTMKP